MASCLTNVLIGGISGAAAPLPGEAEPVAIAGVEPVPWPGADDCAGASALQLTLEDKRRVTMMLQRSFRGDLRLVGDGIIATRDAEQEDDDD